MLFSFQDSKIICAKDALLGPTIVGEIVPNGRYFSTFIGQKNTKLLTTEQPPKASKQ
jgi:hypothetical protein